MTITATPRAVSARLVASLLGLVAMSGAADETATSVMDALKAMSMDDLMHIEVTTVSRPESTVGQSPAAVFVITQEDIRRSGATTIPELFRMVPGMDVARIDNNKWAIGARGFNQRFQDKLLVQIDGRTVYNPIFSGVYWDAVDYPLEDIERIEVIRGPGASVWGANAVNGIINIITKPARATQGGLVSAGAGTEEQGFGTVRYGNVTTNNVYYRLYGKGFTRDEQFAQGDLYSGDAWSGGSAGMRADWQATERDAFTFDCGYLRSVAGRTDLRPAVAAPYVYTNVEDEVSHAGHVQGRWSHTLDKEARRALQAYWDHVERDSANALYHFQWDTLDVDFQHQFPLGRRHGIVYGAGYRYVDARLGGSTRDEGFILSWGHASRHPQLFSAFLQDQIALVEDTFWLTLGSKVEHSDFTGGEVQPTARLHWMPTKRQTVWAAVSRAVRTPNLAEDEIGITLLQGSPGVGPYPRLTGDRNLESEELLATELGYRAQVADSVSVDLAVFYNTYDQLRANVPYVAELYPDATGVPILPVVARNGMDGETYGAEAGATWQVTRRWHLHGAYTLLEMELHHDPDISPSAEAVEWQSPEQQVNLRSSWDLPKHAEFDLMGRYVDSVSGFNPGAPNAAVPNSIAAYVSLDARLACRPRRNLELALVGQNLLDHHHPESGTSSTIASPIVDMQRALYGKVTWTF